MTRPKTRGGSQTGEQLQGPDVDQRRAVSILRVEMRWVVVIKKHLDNNAEKVADFRHGLARVSIRGKCLEASCQLP